MSAELRGSGVLSVYKFIMGNIPAECALPMQTLHERPPFENLTSKNMRIIKNIVKMHSKQLGDGRCAFVIKGEFEFGMARMYELIGGDKIHIRVGVFRSINEAVEWLKQ